MKTEHDLIEQIKGKTVLFVATKDADYIRNVQERALVEKFASSCTVCLRTDKSYIKRLVSIFFWLLTHSIKQYDLVLIGFAPQLLVPFFRRKFKNRTVVIDFFISLYDTMIFDRNKWKDGSFIAKRLHKLDQKTIRVADYVIADTKAHGAYFCEEFGLNPDQLIVLYLQANTTIYCTDIDKRADQYSGRYVVLYFGSVLPLQGVDIVLEAMNRLNEEARIQFIFVGPLSNEQQRRMNRQKNVEWHSWLPQKALAEKIAQSDLCLAGHFNAKIQKAARTIPGKAYIYEAMNKKMILGECPANRELFQADKRHLFVKQGSAQALEETILAAFDADWNAGK